MIEPLTCISNNLRAANPEYGDTVAVIGCGMMGLMILAGLSRSPLQDLIAIDVMDSTL